jgi:hypothetical protein
MTDRQLLQSLMIDFAVGAALASLLAFCFSSMFNTLNHENGFVDCRPL